MWSGCFRLLPHAYTPRCALGTYGKASEIKKVPPSSQCFCARVATGRDERVDEEGAVGPRLEANHAGEDEVHERRVVVPVPVGRRVRPRLGTHTFNKQQVAVNVRFRLLIRTCDAPLDFARSPARTMHTPCGVRADELSKPRGLSTPTHFVFQCCFCKRAGPPMLVCRVQCSSPHPFSATHRSPRPPIRYLARAVQPFMSGGGQFGSVCSSARTLHPRGAYA